ncbi:MAG TPA: hypothetical protein VGJ15_13625 [Pirellulales bacterium]|jgi:hypothetical protein
MHGRFQFSLRTLFLATTGFAVATAVMLPILRSPGCSSILISGFCGTGALVAGGWYFFSYLQLTEYRWSSLRNHEILMYAAGIFLGGAAALVLTMIALFTLIRAI